MVVPFPSPQLQDITWNTSFGPPGGPYVDIRQFGASTLLSDNTASIQDALDSGASRVYIPGGTWLCAAASLPLRLYPGQVIYGDGMDVSIISLPQTNIAGGTTKNLFQLNGDTTDVLIQDIGFRGNLAVQTSAAGNGQSLFAFYLRQGSLQRFTMQRCKCWQWGDQTATGGGSIAIGPTSGSSKAVHDINILDCVFEDNANSLGPYVGILSAYVASAGNISIRGNTLRLSSSSGTGKYCRQNAIFVTGDTGIQVKQGAIANNIHDINEFMDTQVEIDYCDNFVISSMSGRMQSVTSYGAIFTGSAAAVASANLLAAGQEIIFSGISGAVSNINAGEIYYVLASGLSSVQFEFSTSPGGSAVVPNGNGTATVSPTGMTGISIRGTINGFAVGDVSLINGANGIGDVLLYVQQYNSGEKITAGTVNGLSGIDFGEGIVLSGGAAGIVLNGVNQKGSALRLTTGWSIGAGVSDIIINSELLQHSSYHLFPAGTVGAPTSGIICNTPTLIDCGDGATALDVTGTTNEYVTNYVLKDPIIISPVGGTLYVTAPAFNSSTGNVVITNGATLGGLTPVNPSYGSFVASNFQPMNNNNPVFTGVMEGPVGSASAPSYSFTGHTGVGLYYQPTNILGLAAPTNGGVDFVAADGFSNFTVAYQPSAINYGYVLAGVLAAPDPTIQLQGTGNADLQITPLGAGNLKLSSGALQMGTNVGVTFSGAPTGSFATVGGVVTHG